MTPVLDDSYVWIMILVAGIAATGIWRLLGAVFAGRVRDDSEVFAYVKAVATALVAGVVMQIVFVPTGALATSTLALRLGAIALGFTAFLVARRSMLIGMLVGEFALAGGMALGW